MPLSENPEQKAKQIANLIPAKPGESRNPKGRSSVGLSAKEWFNIMKDWTDKQLENCRADRKESAVKKAAAKTWLEAMKYGLDGGLREMIYLSDGKPDVNIKVAETFEANINISIDPTTIALQNYLAEQAAKRRALKVQSTVSDIPSLEIAPIAKQ